MYRLSECDSLFFYYGFPSVIAPDFSTPAFSTPAFSAPRSYCIVAVPGSVNEA